MDSLHDKTLIMIIGPTAIGKSTLMNEIVRLDDRYARVSGFTSRQRRPNDEPGLYRYMSQTEVANVLRSGDVVQSAVHPTTGIVYGSQLSDYPGRYNLLDTLSTVVDELAQLPFERTVTISLTTDPASWKHWLLQRYPYVTAERTKRLTESLHSISWSLQRSTNHHWIVNRPDDIEATAREVIAIIEANSESHERIPDEATKLLKTVESLLSYR